MKIQPAAKILIVSGIILLVASVAIFAFWTTELSLTHTIKPDVWGQFGDLVGGFVGTIFALAGTLLLYKTLALQRESFEKQQIESRFYKMIELHKENVNETYAGFSFSDGYDEGIGRKAFVIMKDVFHKVLNNLRHGKLEDIYKAQYSADVYKNIYYDDTIKISYLIIFYGSKENRSRPFLLENINKINEKLEIQEFYKLFLEDTLPNKENGNVYGEDEETPKKYRHWPWKEFDGFQGVLGHYYRHLFQMVNYINNQTLLSYREKSVYINMLRAQLSNYEQSVFFYNSLSPLGEPWEKKSVPNTDDYKLITKYNLIKNIHPNFMEDIKIEDYYPNVYFEWNDNIQNKITRENYEKRFS